MSDEVEWLAPNEGGDWNFLAQSLDEQVTADDNRKVNFQDLCNTTGLLEILYNACTLAWASLEKM